jgi:hypothetical protein
MASLQRDALNRARAAFKKGDYGEALEQYAYFFDHAQDDDPYSLYGVRLSYCLDEWARLGERYPQARQRLEQKADEALALLGQTREPERFHDFIAICEYLKRKEDPIRRFLGYHASDPDLAKSIVRFIWDQLVEEGQWTVCAAYLPIPQEKYKTVLAKFDGAMQVCKSDPSLGGDELEEQIKGWYVSDVTNLLLVLINTGNTEDAQSIQETVISDMQSRSCAELVDRIDERISL